MNVNFFAGTARAQARTACLAAIVAAALGAAPPSLAQDLTVYTALEKEQLGPYKDAFEKDNPGITITWLRESPGILVARVLAEKDNSQADVFLGVPLTNLLSFDKAGLLLPYKPKGVDALKPRFKDTRENPTWSGMDVWLSLICFNTVEAQKRGLPKPETWSDLANPVYKGQITMPNAVSSQTGYMNVNNWLQTMGEEKGWKFMDGLHENIANYGHSGSKPCKLAATGEYVIGISTDLTAPQLKSKGAPLDIIVPADKVGWDIEATAISKSTKKLEAAKKLADWSVSKNANLAYSKFMAIVAHPDISGKPKNYPDDAEAKLGNDDFAKSLANRDAVLAEWTKRYDAKSEPKQ